MALALFCWLEPIAAKGVLEGGLHPFQIEEAAYPALHQVYIE